MITERRHGNGSWTIDLRPDLPAYIRHQLHLTPGATDTKAWSVLVITDQRVDPAQRPSPDDPEADPHSLLEIARYAGVLTGTNERRTQLEGEGLLALLEDSEGAGFYVSDLADKRSQETASTLIDRILDGGTTDDQLGGLDVTYDVSPLRAGTINSTSIVLSIGDIVRTARYWLRDVSYRAGRRCFRVRPTGEVDWGTRTEIWGDTPSVVVGHNLPATDDPAWTTVRTHAPWSESVLGWAEQAICDPGPTEEGVFLSSGPRYAPSSAPSASWWSPIRFEPLRHQIEVEVESDESIADWRTRAEEALDAEVNTSRVTSYDLSGVVSNDTHIEPGEPIWLWDPEAGLEDTSLDGITYAGQLIFPRMVRLEGITWPVLEGMGVYLLSVNLIGPSFQVLDLSEYVVFDTNREARLELGAAAPSL